jgi:flagellar export protein FliJ
MKHSLGRVLKLRALLEELSQLKLARQNTEVRQLETAAEALRTRARAAHGDRLRRLAEGDAEWHVEVADEEILAGYRTRLRECAESRRPELEASRAELLERRLERRQVETLVTEAAASEATDEARREQKRIDDWFQSRAARAKSGRSASA